MTAPHPHPWEGSYPPGLRGYQMDYASLPANAATVAADAASRYASRAACSLVLPNGASTARSFQDIDALSDAFAAYLVHEMGLQPGQVLALQMPTCLHYPIAVFGAWKAVRKTR